MKHCHRFRSIIRSNWPEQPAQQDNDFLAAHRRECGHCRQEERFWQALAQARPAWQEREKDETSAGDWTQWSKSTWKRIASLPGMAPTPWRRAYLLPATLFAALTAIALFAILPLFRTTRTTNAAAILLPSANLARMESTVAQQEIRDFLDQGQIVLTDLLKPCGGDRLEGWEIRLQAEQARSLLRKRKLFNPQLDQVQWEKARSVCDRMDMFFTELVQVEPAGSCAQISRLQEQLRRENLLLKIRLLQRELEYSA